MTPCHNYHTTIRYLNTSKPSIDAEFPRKPTTTATAAFPFLRSTRRYFYRSFSRDAEIKPVLTAHLNSRATSRKGARVIAVVYIYRIIQFPARKSRYQADKRAGRMTGSRGRALDLKRKATEPQLWPLAVLEKRAECSRVGGAFLCGSPRELRGTWLIRARAR